MFRPVSNTYSQSEYRLSKAGLVDGRTVHTCAHERGQLESDPSNADGFGLGGS